MDKALAMERTLNKNGSLLLYFLLMSSPIRAWLSWTISKRERPVSKSLEGSEGCVPIHNSAYGLSDCMEKSSRGVAAAYLAAAESLPFFPHS